MSVCLTKIPMAGAVQKGSSRRAERLRSRMHELEARAIVEAALLTAQRPLAFKELQTLVGERLGREELKDVLAALAEEWRQRKSLELVESAMGWRFATQPGVRAHLEPLHAERPQRYSRAVMETLAVIAYRQPVTRGDIEDIRGVVIGSPIIKQLEDRGWIDCIGHRDAPGRPALYATTRQFLDDLGLASLSELPPLEGPDGTPVLPDLPAQASLLPLAEADLLVAGDVVDAESPELRAGVEEGSAAAEPTAGQESEADAMQSSGSPISGEYPETNPPNGGIHFFDKSSDA